MALRPVEVDTNSNSLNRLWTLGAYAEKLELPLLQDAQKLRLKLKGNFTDFIEEDSSAIRQLEASHTLADRTRDGALLVSE